MSQDEAYSYSIKLLAKKDYSIHKLSQKLTTKGFEEFDIQKTIDVLIAKRFINEEEFTKKRISGLAHKHYSNNYIYNKLKNEQLPISEELIENTRYDNRIEEIDSIKNLIAKKDKDLKSNEDPRKKLQKLISFMYSKGYSFEQIEAFIPSRLTNEF